LLVPLAFAGGFDDFLKSYFVKNRPLFDVEDWHNPLATLIGNAPIFRALLEAYAAMFALAVVAVALSAGRIAARPTIAPVLVWTLALGLVLVLAAFVSIVLPGGPTYHYLLLAVPAVVTLGGVGLAVAVVLGDAYSLIRWLTFGVTLAIGLPAAHREQQRPGAGE